MDPKLAEIYGTNQPTDADLEKLAAAELAEGLANDDQLSTEGMSEEELEAVAQEVLAGGEGGEGGEDGDEGGQEKTSAQQNLEDADYMGRVMAHSYVNELRAIEKTAGSKMEGAKKAVKQLGHRVGRAAESLGSKLTPDKLSDKAFKSGKKGAFGKMRGPKDSQGLHSGMKPSEIAKSPAAMEAGRSAGHSRMGNLHKAVGGGAAVGGVGAASYGAKKALEKKSSAVDTLVEQRAQEILAESGINPDELERIEGQEKVSDPREALAEQVEQRAWDLLGQFGVVPAEAEQE